ncbi:hypothetical protein BH10ACT3_BH10ACT3_14120 [soil metagenome]
MNDIDTSRIRSSDHATSAPGARDTATSARVIDARVTSVSWIPSEAVTGPMNKAMFAAAGPAHYDDPPADVLGDLATWKAEDRFRFANDLRAAIRIEDGADGPRIVGADYTGESMIGSTTMTAGRRGVTFAAVALPELREEPEIHSDHVRFVQTYGGRTGVPAPRRVNRPPFVQMRAPLVWTTLAVTIHVDGRVTHEVVGASKFPRHWIYEHDTLIEKVGLADFSDWYRTSFGRHTPWGDEQSPALVTAVESALERELSHVVMHVDAEPEIRAVDEGTEVVRQGDAGDDLFLLLDGVLSIEVDGEVVAEVGPGAILGERAGVETGVRTSTMRAVTPCRLAVARADAMERDALVDLSRGHRREVAHDVAAMPE